jgi:NADPH-dependent ferric siderophore reductase
LVISALNNRFDANIDDQFAATLAEIQPELLERINEDFEDSVTFVVRVLGRHPAAEVAQVVSIDRRGIDVEVVGDAGGDHRDRLEFATPLDNPFELQTALFELIVRARAESGERGATSAEREAGEMAAIRTFLAEVVTVDDVHPHLRRVVVSGNDLATFVPTAPDTFVYVLLPPPGRDELTIDQSFTWEGYEHMGEADRPVGAYYTVRRWDAARRELTMLMVRHGDDGAASAWIGRAQPGDPLALWGPRTAYHPPVGTDRYVLVADDTGLPAVAAILESLPNGAPATVFAEVADESERQDLPAADRFDIRWLYRDGAEPGTTTLLADAVRALDWPAGALYVWGGGESRAMTAVRRYVRDERGLRREAVSLVAYWRR